MRRNSFNLPPSRGMGPRTPTTPKRIRGACAVKQHMIYVAVLTRVIRSVLTRVIYTVRLRVTFVL